ncbi:GTP-binding protein [Desulfosporosinus nitroreducens]|uniref:CobW/HypB/UreG nucleotide-binding domain-containing protein n=1 Tax=Desulfosporosinus nitroreducens TaxID=2018668 RepID=A0ABT8QVC2_9FIRM|nr:GTP-binding protein [Desulfosporosinus nitroreducens]MDO0825290.1 hypothetical protein [Desulfosporosinus nitroreducens]
MWKPFSEGLAYQIFRLDIQSACLRTVLHLWIHPMLNAGFKVDNLFAGCACCSLSGELVSSIKNIQKALNPEWLIIEATGVAYPGSIGKAILESLGLDAYIITIVDAKRWRRLQNAMETLMSEQLKDSSIVLFS